MRALSWVVFSLFVAAGIVAAWFAYQIALLQSGDPALGLLRLQFLCASLATGFLGAAQKILDSAFARSMKKVLKLQRARLYEVFDGPMLLLLEQIERMAVEEEPQKYIMAIRQSVVRAACEVVEAEKPRASYFQVEDVAAKYRVMTCLEYNYSNSRADKPTTRFIEGSGVDDGVWMVMEDGKPRYEKDLVKSPPSDMPSSIVRVYKCFITLRIQVGGVGIGILTINAIERNELTGSDLSILRSLAELLSVAESVAIGSIGIKLVRKQNQQRLSSKVGAA